MLAGFNEVAAEFGDGTCPLALVLVRQQESTGPGQACQFYQGRGQAQGLDTPTGLVGR